MSAFRFRYQLTGLNGVGPLTWSISSGALPAGLLLSPAGLVSGVPAAATFTSPRIRLTDGNTTIIRAVDFDIQAIQITSPGILPNATLGAAYSTTLQASGGTGPYVFGLSTVTNGNTNSLPAGLSLDASGEISGTPTGGRGITGFTVTVTDANGVSTSKGMAIVVILPPQPAARLQPYNATFDDCSIGVPCERGVSTFAGGTGPFVWSISGQPPGMKIVDQPWIWARDFLIGGTPTQAGTFNIEVTVTDALGISTTNVFPMHVSPMQQRFDSFRRTDLVDGVLDTAYTSKLSITGGTLPYTATIIAGQLPPGLTFNPATFEVTGTPTASGNYFVDIKYEDAAGETLTLRDYLYIDGTSGTGTVDILTAANLGTFTVGSSVSRILSACCVPSFLWSALEPLPSGINLSESGVLSGTAASWRGSTRS